MATVNACCIHIYSILQYIQYHTVSLLSGRVCKCCTRVQDPADHARQQHDEEREDLQVGCQQGASLSMAQVLSSQGTLNNHLHTRRFYSECNFFYIEAYSSAVHETANQLHSNPTN